MKSRTKKRRRVAMPLGNPEANFLDSSIYEPPPASPRKLDRESRALWDRAYQESLQGYAEAGDEIPNAQSVAARTAWRALAAGQMPPLGTRRVPTDADVIVLGRLIEFGYVDERARLQIRNLPEPDPPELLWDHERKLLYCFPDVRPSKCDRIPPNMQRVAALYERWAQRRPHCYTRIDVPPYTVRVVGLADTVTYRSDKWHEQSDEVGLRDAMLYIHDLGPNVWCWLDVDTPQQRGFGQLTLRDCKAIVIGGGRLDMHEKGLIH